MVWVVAYDITKDRQRSKIAKLLEQRGLRLQKSVFLVDARRGTCTAWCGNWQRWPIR